MWLATLIVCTTLDATSCELISQPNNLYMNKTACSDAVEQGTAFFLETSIYISGGCVKIGEST